MLHHRLADLSGPFYSDKKPFRNWSALPYYQLDLPVAPFVDIEQLNWGVERAIAQLEQLHAQGYTGIVVDNLAHLVQFDQTPIEIYPPNSSHRLRAEAYIAAFTQVFDAAAAHGLQVFVTTDMQWMTPPVRWYVGRLAADNPRMIEVNRWSLEELFTRFPQVHGLFIRVGEAGGSHDHGEYSGHMLYRSPAELRGLIDSLLPTCTAFDRLLVVRTWSIGIGDLGDLLWSDECYAEVFGGYTSPHLLVSVKHGPSDFFRYLEPNPTIGLPGPKQIVEVQTRREYELFGMVPSGIATLHQQVVQHAEALPQCVGVWAWNGTGGWGGGSAVLGTTGWSIWTELSSALTVAMARQPDLDPAAFVQNWCQTRFPADVTFATAVATTYLESETLIEHGWYPGRPGRGPSTLGDLYLPQLLWVWWMRPTAAPIMWAQLAASRDDLATTLSDAAAAARRLDQLATQLASLRPTHNAEAQFVCESTRYLADTVGVAAAIWSVMLPAYAAALHNDRDGWLAAAAQAEVLLAQLRSYRTAWEGRSDLPPLELDEMLAFLEGLRLAPLGFWPVARAAALLIEQIHQRRLSRRAQIAQVLTTACALTMMLLRRGTHLAVVLGALLALLLTPKLRQRAMRRALPFLAERYYLVPSIFFEAGPALTEWTQ
jgi:hypothetical protein